MLEWDREAAACFREKAVTNVNDLVIGETYWTNCYPNEFVLKELITMRESYKRSGLEYHREDADEIQAFVTEEGRVHYLHDYNVGNSYNPWMIFKNEEDAQAAEDGIETWNEHDEMDDYFDQCDYYDDYDYDYDYDIDII